MGFAIAWCAVPENDAVRFLERIGLSPTGKSEEFPESPVSSAKLDTGWRLIWVNDYACPFLDPKALRETSSQTTLLVCHVEEHVMASSSELWIDGQRRWWISHEGENGPKGLDADGDLPECFPAITSELEECQQAEGGDAAEVDHLFDIPLKVAQVLVGFKHDEDSPHIQGGSFDVLAGQSVRPKGFFQRLFVG